MKTWLDAGQALYEAYWFGFERPGAPVSALRERWETRTDEEKAAWAKAEDLLEPWTDADNV